MFRSDRRALFAAVFALAVTASEFPAGAAGERAYTNAEGGAQIFEVPEGSEGLRLCEENEYLLHFGSHSFIQVFDADGKYITEFQDYSYGCPLCIAADSMVISCENGVNKAILVKTGQVIFEGRVKDYLIENTNDILVSVNKYNGSFAVYNNTGVEIYCSGDGAFAQTDLAAGGALPESEPGRSPMPDGGWYIPDGVRNAPGEGSLECKAVIYPLDGGNLVYVRAGDKKSALLVRADCTCSVFDNPILFPRLEDYGTFSFGRYLGICRGDEDIWDLYDLEGNQVMGGFFEQCREDMFSDGYSQRYRGTEAAYVLREENGKIIFYDHDLHSCGELDPEDIEYGRFVCSHGMMEGIYLPEPGGICEGMIPYNDGYWPCYTDVVRKVPWTSTEEGYLIFGEKGDMIRAPYFEGEELYVAGTGYVVYKHMGGDLIIRKRDTFEPLASVPGNDSDYGMGTKVYVIESGVIIAHKDGTTTCYDNEGNLAYIAENARVYPWKCGRLHVYRGIYEGYTDIYGRWLIRWQNNRYEP